MALADPQIITINSVAQTLPRVESNGRLSVYQLADLSYMLRVSHQTAGGKAKDPRKRIRTLAQITHRVIVADPLTAVNDYDTASFQIVMDRPEVGFTLAQLQNDWAGFKAWMDNTIVSKFIGGES
jgi:hypothetical protein